MDGAAPIAFDNSYAGLPERFFAARAPTPVAAPRLIAVNERLAEALGIDAGWLAGAEGVAMVAGNAVPAGAAPIALAYAGHQFGQFVPALGDGRAVLLGEVIGRDGRRFDIQLKGSGPTRFSRRGDGRAALGPVLREYLVSEAMAALGVPTTRALAAVTTGETVMREAALPGAVLARVAASHIRVGTFAWFAARGDTDGLRTLTDYAIARHDPDLAGEPGRVGAFLGRVIGRQARLIAAWLGIGFIHGVMNTDNMAVSGETIDYGPCAFLDAYDPGAVFSSIDHGGRYAFGNQPRMALWNLTRLAEALLPLLGETEAAALAGAEQALASFAPAFTEAHQAVMRGKLGLVTARPGDERLVEEFLALLADNEADFTQSFRALAGEALPDWMGGWSAGWQARLAEEPGDVAGRLRAANPAVIPRNHLVEQAIAAALRQDYSPFRQFLAAWARPFDEPEDARLTAPPRPDQLVTATFCGT